MLKPWSLALMAVLTFLAPWPAWSQSGALPAGMNRVTSVEGITEYRLPNGLQVLLVPDDAKPTTTVNVTYRVGSRHENYGETPKTPKPRPNTYHFNNHSKSLSGIRSA